MNTLLPVAFLLLATPTFAKSPAPKPAVKAVAKAKSKKKSKVKEEPAVPAAPLAESREELSLKTGEKKVLQVKQLRKLKTSNPEVADIQVMSDSGLEVIGKSEGKAELQVTTDREQITYAVTVGNGIAVDAQPTEKAAGEPLESGNALEVKLGKNMSFDVPGLARLALGDPSLCNATAEGDTVKLEGVAPGSTTLRVWDKENRKAEFVVLVR